MTKEEISQSIGRIEKFYQEDTSDKMKAFMRKPCFTIESSDLEISLMVQSIKDELMKNLNVDALNEKSEESHKEEEKNRK